MSKEKMAFEKLEDGTCVITVSGENQWGQGYSHQDIVSEPIYNAVKKLSEQLEDRKKARASVLVAFYQDAKMVFEADDNAELQEFATGWINIKDWTKDQ